MTPRIASLIPSGTDIVAALGLEGGLVGVSHECDHPVAAGKPVLTASAIPHGLDAAGIDAAVGDTLSAGESLYRADRELLGRLQPDLVLSQDVCDVCAVNAETAACALPEGASLVMLNATSLSGLWADLRRVGEAAGVPGRAEALVAGLEARLAAVARRVAGRPRPRVLALEWGDPPFLGGHWVPELAGLAGGEHLLAGPGEPSRRASWAEIAAADPDVVVFMPCGYDLGAAVREGRALLGRPEVRALRAAREGNVWATDATALFSRCTPASARAAEVLAGILHPEVAEPPAPHEAVRLSP